MDVVADRLARPEIGQLLPQQQPDDVMIGAGQVVRFIGIEKAALAQCGQPFERGDRLDAFAQGEQPDHRGALMGRALVFIQTDRHDNAIAELSYLIDFSNRILSADDSTGRGVLAAAYANRGIVHDRAGHHEKAFAD